MAGTFHLGTSGFAYDAWRHGVFYPEGLPQKGQLAYYASRFNSVEINYSFRRFPSETTLETWRDAVPGDFRFTLKANQRITHTRRLREADTEVGDFLERAKTLGDRLGTILYQCPPSLKYDRSLIEAFVGYLPPAPRAAMEFRHPSWREARELLEAQGVAWCVAETDERDPEPTDLSWSPFGYLRLRKSTYEDAELKAWAERIRAALDGGADIYCYFKHEDEEPQTTRLAERLGAMVGLER